MDMIIDVVKNTVDAFNFKGSIKSDELPSSVDNYEFGDIVVDEDGYVYAKRDHYFEMIDNPRHRRHNTFNQSPELANRKMITKCECCGASLPVTELSLTLGYVQCEYCNTFSQVFR